MTNKKLEAMDRAGEVAHNPDLASAPAPSLDDSGLTFDELDLLARAYGDSNREKTSLVVLNADRLRAARLPEFGASAGITPEYRAAQQAKNEAVSTRLHALSTSVPRVDGNTSVEDINRIWTAMPAHLNNEPFVKSLYKSALAAADLAHVARQPAAATAEAIDTPELRELIRAFRCIDAGTISWDKNLPKLVAYFAALPVARQPQAAPVLDFSKQLETAEGEPVTYICADVIQYKSARICVDQATGIVYSSPYIGLKIRNAATQAAPTLGSAPQAAQMVEVPPIYYMRDDHTFCRLTNEVDAALHEIKRELEDGYTSGMLCSRRKGTAPVLHFDYRKPLDEMIELARQWLVVEIADRVAAPSPAAAQEGEQGSEQAAPVAIYSGVEFTRYTIEWTNGPLPRGTKLYAAPLLAQAAPAFFGVDLGEDGIALVRDTALEEAAKICDSVNNHDNPMTARDCADAIRALRSTSTTADDSQKGGAA